MAERRMFAKTIISSGRFLRMPPTSRLLYYDLGMAADDDGVVEAYSVMVQTKATEDDLRVLVAKGYVRILNEDLVTQICDWKINNVIRGDRYHKSIYAELIAPQPSDNQMTTNPQPNDNQMETEVRLGKVSIGKDNIYSASSDEEPPASKPEKPKKRFVKPTLDEVRAYCRERNNNVDPESFIAYYESNGWRVGKNPMKNWKSAIVTWERNGFNKKATTTSKPKIDMDDPNAYEFNWEQIRKDYG